MNITTYLHMALSGLHRWLRFFQRLPKLLERAGIDLNAMLCWEDEIEIIVPDGRPSGVIGMAPVHKPLRTIGGLLGNNDLFSPAVKAALALFFGVAIRHLSRSGLSDHL